MIEHEGCGIPYQLVFELNINIKCSIWVPWCGKVFRNDMGRKMVLSIAECQHGFGCDGSQSFEGWAVVPRSLSVA